MKTSFQGRILKAGLGAWVAAGVMAAGLVAGCADKSSSTLAASKPLAPPSYQDPVPPKFFMPNTNPSMIRPAPPQPIGSVPEV